MCNPFTPTSSTISTYRNYYKNPLGMSHQGDSQAFLISGPVPRKKIRIVCVSDTHNSSPLNGAFKVPPGDVLIHAGDMTNQGSYSELKKAVEWIGSCAHEVKLVIAGNHDGVTLDPTFDNEFGANFHTQAPQSHIDNVALFTSQEAVDKDGRTFGVFGSPWSPKCGLWGFGYDESQSLYTSIWKDIPLDTDIIITHGPPKYHLDGSTASRGCEHLRQAVWTVRPYLHVFGHIHESRGVERVRWDTKSKFVKFKEESTTIVEDPGAESARQFVVDLTKRHGNVLDNDGTLDGKKETCLVNAAMVTRPWKKGAGHGARNKAIIVDVDVQVVEQLGQVGLIPEETEVKTMELIVEE